MSMFIIIKGAQSNFLNRTAVKALK